MIHLDTSFLIRALVPATAEDRALRNWIEAGTSLGMSTIAWTEFLCGPLDEDQIRLVSRLIERIIPFDAEHAASAAGLFNRTGRRRGTLIDCMIAATVLCADAQLASCNLRDFRRFAKEGLKLAESGA